MKAGILKKAFTAVAAVLLTVLFFCTGVYANWYDEVSGGSYAQIEGDPYVADTFCGVEALYSETTYQYQCNELIMRFYERAYNLSVMAYMNTGLIMLTDGYEFKIPSVPKKGDIIYSPAKYRNNSSDHWAIVKDYSNGKITLFEQNVVWEGKAGTGRKLNYPSDWYYLYTPVAKPGYPDPVLRDASTGNEVPQNAQTTAVSTTTAPTEKETATSKAPATTAPPSTTVKQTVKTTTAVTASVKVTEKVTEKPAQTAKAAVTQTTAQTPAVTEEQTALISQDEETPEISGTEFDETSSESSLTATETVMEKAEESEEDNIPKKITVIACAVLAAAAGTLVIIINKARRKS